jgi:uncharacterized protein (TIGR02996 family)
MIMSALREALEAALVEQPDDLASHMAYADYLRDQGDPRGELIQVQLAQEDEALPGPERAQLALREAELLGKCDNLLGARLGPLLTHKDPYSPPPRYTIERGWLASVEVSGQLDRDLADALATASEARLLRRLVLGWLPNHHYESPDDLAPLDVIEVLGRSRTLSNLRTLFLNTMHGFEPDQDEGMIVYNSRHELYLAAGSVWDWIATLPRLEELSLACPTLSTGQLFTLPNLTNLRVLQLYWTDDYPLDVLARNPALGRVTHLACHPLAPDRDDEGMAYLQAWHLAAVAHSPHLRALTHLRFQKSDAGDEGVRSLIQSGMLARLKFLDLAYGTITDVGAGLLSEADLGSLEVLDVRDNSISSEGRRQLGLALKRKLTLRMENQHDPDDREWLFWGEME